MGCSCVCPASMSSPDSHAHGRHFLDRFSYLTSIHHLAVCGFLYGGDKQVPQMPRHIAYLPLDLQIENALP